jgi:hypothetical protein
MTPPSVGSSGSSTSSGPSRTESVASSAERQSQILADHDGSGQGPAVRRITQTTHVLDHEEKAFI